MMLMTRPWVEARSESGPVHTSSVTMWNRKGKWLATAHTHIYIITFTAEAIFPCFSYLYIVVSEVLFGYRWAMNTNISHSKCGYAVIRGWLPSSELLKESMSRYRSRMAMSSHIRCCSSVGVGDIHVRSISYTRSTHRMWVKERGDKATITLYVARKLLVIDGKA